MPVANNALFPSVTLLILKVYVVFGSKSVISSIVSFVNLFSQPPICAIGLY